MKPVIISDTGPLIALAKLDLLHLLPTLFSTVYVPQTVFQEAIAKQHNIDTQRIIQFSEKFDLLDDINNTFSQSLEVILDKGEIQAIVHARKHQCAVLMDEKRGRKVAQQHGIPTIGVIGILLQAKNTQQIIEIKKYILALQSCNYRLSNHLIKTALKLAGEDNV